MTVLQIQIGSDTLQSCSTKGNSWIEYLYAQSEPNYPMPATLAEVEITRAYVAFHHWTWVPNILRPLHVIYRNNLKRR